MIHTYKLIIIENISPKASVENSSAQWAILFYFFQFSDNRHQSEYSEAGFSDNLWFIPLWIKLLQMAISCHH